MRRVAPAAFVAVPLAACLAAYAPPAAADTFQPGSLVVPMDTAYQDGGMLRAYGLLYDLLKKGVPVRWTIRKGKTHLGVDFTATGVDLKTNASVTAHGYRGGPFVVDSADAAAALPIVQAWQAANPAVAVHKATQSFSSDVARYLVAAPTIAMHQDGHEDIARSYVQAAGIPDSTGDIGWPLTSPDMLTPQEVAGPTTSSHHDGKLFDAQGRPAYCQFMSMHWDVNDSNAIPETTEEVREFLKWPAHFFAECQAVNAFEGEPPVGGRGKFLTTTGYKWPAPAKPTSWEFHNDDWPFAQIDGPFQSVGGSEPAYWLPLGGAYKAPVIMIKAAGAPDGSQDVWMTGFLDGGCPAWMDLCPSGVGKVSYLGGHQYSVSLPISKNPNTQGTRLFLNALFEAPCGTANGQPTVAVQKSAPAQTTVPTVTFTLAYSNGGPGIAYAFTLEDPLPAGTTFVSCTGGCAVSGGVVKWSLGTLGAGQAGSVSFTVTLGALGTYTNGATAKYKVGVTPKSMLSNTTQTVYDKDTDGDGVVDTLDICPVHPNPKQDLQSDILSCGACGVVCKVQNGSPACLAGKCAVADCNPGWNDCNGLYADGCELPSTAFPNDPQNCGGCNVKCSYPNAQPICSSGACAKGACNGGWSDCDGQAANGCEYADSGFANDPNNCGGCGKKCAPGFTCASGQCVADTCPSGFADCNGLSGDGCEYPTSGFQTDPNNCGACGKKCAPANATPKCAGGACGIAACSGGWSDCNGQAADGCEYADAGFATDPNNCGACGKKCAAPNAKEQCSAGTCGIQGCGAGWSDCNGQAADGCEYANAGFATDPANCGGCGKKCASPNAVPKCSAGACGIAGCQSGWVDLDGDAANGCEYACSKKGPTDATCDGVDDDCNGKIDDGYAPKICGQGACVAASTCTGGQDKCTPGPASTEGPPGDATCADGTDNDCDGLTDAADPDCVAPEGGVADAGADGSGAGGAGDADDGAGGTGGGTAVDGTAEAGGAGASDAGSSGASGDEAASETGGDVGQESASAGGSGGGAGTGGGAGGAGKGGSSGGAGKGGGAAPDAGMAGADGADAAGGQAGDATAESGDQGGCACRGARAPAREGWPAVLSLAAAVAARRRRRR